MNETQLTLAAAILAFVASVIATVVAAYNGRFRRYALERWWDRKAEAYARVIEALADLVYYHETHLRAAEEHRDLSDEKRGEIETAWKRGSAEVRRAAAIGAFLISPKAEAALKALYEPSTSKVHANDWYGAVEDGYVSTRAALTAVVEAAKNDLHRA
jgi:hypothetical protein